MAVAPNVFAIQQVFEADIFDLETGAIKAHMEELKTSGIENTGETVYAMGGAGNPYIIGFSHSKRATATIENAIFTSEVMGIQVGNDVITGVNTKAVKRDVLTVNDDEAETTFVATGTAGEEIGVIYTLDIDGSFVTKLEQAVSPAAGKFSYDPLTKTIAFDTYEIADGTLIAVYYNHDTGAGAKTIQIDSNKFAGNYKVVFTGLVRNICTGVDFKAQIIYFKAKVSDNWSFDLSADGDPAVHGMEIEALKSCGSQALYEMIIFDPDEI